MKKLTATILSVSMLFTNSAFCADVQTKPIKKVGKNTFISNTTKYVKKNSPLLTLNLAGLIVGGYFLNKLSQSLNNNTQKLSSLEGEITKPENGNGMVSSTSKKYGGALSRLSQSLNNNTQKLGSLEDEIKKIKDEYSTIEKQIRSQNIMSGNFDILRNERDNLEIERCNMIELAEYLEDYSHANLMLIAAVPDNFNEDEYAENGIHLPLIFDIYDCTTNACITRLDARTICDMEKLTPVYSKISKIISPTLSCNLFVCKSIGNKTCHQFSRDVFGGTCKMTINQNTLIFENEDDDLDQNNYVECNGDNDENDSTEDLDDDNDSTSNTPEQRSIVKQLSRTDSTIYRSKTDLNCFILRNSRGNSSGIKRTKTKKLETVLPSQLKETSNIDQQNTSIPNLKRGDTISLDTNTQIANHTSQIEKQN